MSLILAIEPDRRQAAQLTSVIRGQVGAELVLSDTTERALVAIGTRVPDLVLVPALLSPQDDAALAAALRVIASAAHVQMLTIPLLATSTAKTMSRGGVFSALRRDKTRGASPDGCDPAVFAAQVSSYLESAIEQRSTSAIDDDPSAATDEPSELIVEPPAAEEIVAAHEMAPVEIVAAIEAVAVAEEVAVEEVVAIEAVAVAEEPVAVEEVAAIEAVAVVEEPVAAEEMVAVQAVVVAEDVVAVEEIEAVSEPAMFDMHESSTVADLADADLWTPLSASAAWPVLASAVSERLPDSVVASSVETLVVVTQPDVEETLATVVEDIVEPDDFDADEGIVAADALAALAAAQVDTAPDVMYASPEPVISPESETLVIAIEDEVAEEPLAKLRQEPLESLFPESMLVSVEIQPLEETEVDIIDIEAEEFDLNAELEALGMSVDIKTIAAGPGNISLDTNRFVPHGLWMPLTKGALWPQLQGMLVEASPDVLMAMSQQAAPVKRPRAEPVMTPPDSPRASAPDWVELIESLRRDIERLRTERAEAPSSRVSAPTTATPAPVQSSQARDSSAKPTAGKPKRRRKKPADIQDEWGFFDPEQCGFSALLAKLDEVTGADDDRSDPSA